MHPTIRVAQLLHVLRRIEGRKKLQKIVHILQELGAPFFEPFQYSQYGMYSQQLTAEIRHLVNDHLVTEQETYIGTNKAFVFEGTDELADLLKSLNVEQDPNWATRGRELNELPAQMLEGISTVLFLRKRGYESEDLRFRLIALKPHLASLAQDCITKASDLTRDRISR
ncbi:MAG TPA: hypothetical protein VGW57_01330 [Chthoniobacterales bacterium]|nr:hypothetical protein [Chthoniobacterales bacterium]